MIDAEISAKTSNFQRIWIPAFAGMTGLVMDIDAIGKQQMGLVEAATNLEELESARIAVLGKNGELTAILKTLGSMSPEERVERGHKVNLWKAAINGTIAAQRTIFEQAQLNARLATERLDMTLPAPEHPRGSIHPVSQVMDELAEIFADMGFAVAEGPEIEDDWHNFTALNIPETHPARAMHDTFYFPADSDGIAKLLRTHTSPVQIRTMTSQTLPIRIIAPGRVYRSDSDATHTPMFHQIEGLVIDKGIHLGHQIGRAHV